MITNFLFRIRVWLYGHQRNILDFIGDPDQMYGFYHKCPRAKKIKTERQLEEALYWLDYYEKKDHKYGN